MMNFKKKFFGIGLVAMLCLSFASGVFADDTKTNDVDITVQAGEFSLTTANINSFGNITLQATPQTYNTSFENDFSVKDLRGSQEGWRLDVEASPFTSGMNTLPAGSLSLAPIDAITRVGTGSGDSPTKSTTTNMVIDDGAVEV